MDTLERYALVWIALLAAVLLIRLGWRVMNRSYDRQEAWERRQLMKRKEADQFAQWERELDE